MFTDLDIIKQLEQEIGQKLEQISLDKVTSWYRKNGYAVDKNNNVIGLNLDKLELCTIPNALINLKNLQRLSLLNNKVDKLPDSFVQLQNLSVLILGSNQLKKLPASFGQLQNLSVLGLWGNQLKELPDSFVQLQKLSYLFLNENWLKELPASFVQLQKLSCLFLNENQLKELPASFGQLQKLSKLELRNNQLKELPAWFGKLLNLSELDLMNNQLQELPASFGKLLNLSELDLRNNQLKELPASVGQLKNSCHLYISYNPLEIPPLEIAEKGIEAIRNYFKEHEKQPLNEAKVLIVGQGGVGKTSLVKRLVFNEFDEHENQTHGINIQNWQVEINNEQIRLNVWDFGGQEIMHATHQFFLTKRSLYLLILDARQEEQYSRVEYWLKLIQTYGVGSPVIIATNKIDQQPLELNEKELLRKYPNIKEFHQISCKNTDNIQNIKQDIFKHIDQLKHIHDLLPKSWFNIKTQLENMQQDFISYEEYAEICEQKNIDSSSQKTLIDFLHDLGIVLNFREDNQRPYLKETNILNPEWITQGIYTILNSYQLFQSKGILDLVQLPDILPNSKKYPENKHRFIMDIMEKFQLCFEFPDVKNRFLIPDLLSKQEPDINWDYENSLCFELHYDVLPNSVISRFIVHLHKLASKNTYWRTGVVLIQNQAKAQVKADIEEKIIYIYVTGNQRRELLQTVRVTFENIRRTIAKLVVKEQVPYKNILIPYQDLVLAEEMGEKEYTIYSLKQKVSVKALLNGIETYRNKQIGQTLNIIGDVIMAERTISVNDGGDYVEGDKVAGDKVMGSKIDKQVSIGGNVSGSNINLGDNVNQSLTTDNRSTDELLTELSELIKAFPESEDKQEALNEYNLIKLELGKSSSERNERPLKKSLSYLPEVLQCIAESAAATNIVSLIKSKIFGI